MSTRELIAIMPAEDPVEAPQGLSMHTVAEFRVILGRSRSAVALKPGRKGFLKSIVRRQRCLEHLMRYGTVLPAMPHTFVKRADLPAMIAANGEILAGQLSRLAGMVQFQVTVTWDDAKARSHFGLTSPDDAAACAARLSAQFRGALEPVVDEWAALPIEPGTLMNAALLLPADREIALDAALERIDAVWSDGLTIRQIGPAPAVSFASLGLRFPGKADRLASLNLLRLPWPTTIGQIAQARRNALMQPAADAEAIRSAADVLSACCRAATSKPPPLAFIWQEGTAAPAPGRRLVA